LRCRVSDPAGTLLNVTTDLNKAIVDYTSPALCTPVTPFQADPIFSERGSDGMIPCAARHYNNNNNNLICIPPECQRLQRRSNDPFCSESVIVHCQWGRKRLTADTRCGLLSTCRRRTEPDMGNMHKKFGKNHACGSGDNQSDRQTHRRTDRRTHHNTS